MTTTQRTTKSPTTRQTGLDPTRRAATIVGWLFVVTYVTSISAKVGFYPPLFDGNYVTGPGEDSRVLWGAFAECILIIANIGSATALYTVVKHRYPNLGLSFIAARIMESVFIGVGILAVLTVVTLRQDYAAADDQSAAGLAAVGNAFIVMQEWTFNLGPAFVVGVGNGCILGWMMWRTGLVPRRLAMFGLVGGPFIVATGSAAVLGLIDPGGAVQQLSAAPEFIWELGLGIYLIVKGFKTPNANTPSGPSRPWTRPSDRRSHDRRRPRHQDLRRLHRRRRRHLHRSARTRHRVPGTQRRREVNHPARRRRPHPARPRHRPGPGPTLPRPAEPRHGGRRPPRRVGPARRPNRP